MLISLSSCQSVMSSPSICSPGRGALRLAVEVSVCLGYPKMLSNKARLFMSLLDPYTLAYREPEHHVSKQLESAISRIVAPP